MDAVGYILKKTYFKKCFLCVFLGHKSTLYQRKNKNLKKTTTKNKKKKTTKKQNEKKKVLSKIKISSVHWKIKRFNDRVKVKKKD